MNGALMWASVYLASCFAVVLFIAWLCSRAPEEPFMDPSSREDAARTAEDERWAGIEEEWHAFVDSFGVREVHR